MSAYNFLSKMGIKIVRIFFIVFAALFGFFNFFFTTEIDNLGVIDANYEFGLTPFRVIYLIIICILIIVLIKKKYFGMSDKKMMIMFLLLALIVSVYWLITNDYHLADFDDAYNVFRSAKAIANYDYSVLGNHTYINVYPNNLGLLTYELICIKIFGEFWSIYFIRIVNIVFMLLGYYYLYRITDILFNDKMVNCTVVFLMFLSGQYIFYSFFLYGNCLSYSLAIMSVYYLIKYIKYKKNINLVLSSVFIVCSVTIKMNSLIVLIAESLYLLLNSVKTKKIFVIIILFVNFIGAYCGTIGIQKFWSVRGDADYDNTKLPLLCWVAYGVNYNEKTPGRYFPEFEEFHFANDFVQEYTNIEARRYINQAKSAFLNNPILGIRFYSKKFLYSWASPQYEAFDQYRFSKLTYLNKEVISGNINTFMDYVWDAAVSIVAIGIIAFLFINKKERQILDYIGCVIVIGGFLFHIVWEVKAIYLYQYYMYLLPYAAYGLVVLLQNRLKIGVR